MLIKEKIHQAAQALTDCGLDCWITFTRETEINGDSILPFLVPGPLTWHSAFIITPDGRARAIVGRYDRAAVEETGAYDEVYDFVTSFREPFLACLRAIDPARIAVNYSEDSEICDGLTHGMFLTLQGLLGELGMADRLVSAEFIVAALRERKSAGELASMREAIRQAQEVFQLVQGQLVPGRTEQEIAAFMQAEVRRRGLAFAWHPDTCPSVFTGPDTAEAHYSPTARAVEPGHLVTMDFGVRVDGYCSDLQRTFYVARPGETALPEAVRHGFDTLRQAIEAAKATLKPGVRGLDADTAARQTILAAGYEEYPFGLGHQVGRFAHDGTALLGPAWAKYASKPFKPLEGGMVFTIEPRLSVPGHGIVSIEEMVVITATGAEWLSDPQLELPLLASVV
ncbi:Xaa-Pro peptidase family protein [Geothrix sp. PMB-07]|uniref:M24 family metallopeptidase n=1 Tax=Geothrix sp. PMB-07 TaxID=3068640 RepID=UPI0027418F3F|nr:Xaa-Pro peptidase family protein [Geothrix sp. PMB-07]WLT30963.1 Xaa-Pro peptidase family protein [Geothrix sp. PMB-07]